MQEVKIGLKVSPTGRIYTAAWDSGRTYRTIVPPGAWNHPVVSAEEWIAGVAGVRMPRGMYG